MRLSHGRLSHGRLSHRKVSHRRVSYRGVSYRVSPNRRSSHRESSHRRSSLDLIMLDGLSHDRSNRVTPSYATVGHRGGDALIKQVDSLDAESTLGHSVCRFC